MPLTKGYSKKIISKNISEMSKKHPHAQAVAAALRVADIAKKAKAKKKA